jgi:hypothetical protein
MILCIKWNFNGVVEPLKHLHAVPSCAKPCHLRLQTFLRLRVCVLFVALQDAAARDQKHATSGGASGTHATAGAHVGNTCSDISHDTLLCVAHEALMLGLMVMHR